MLDEKVAVYDTRIEEMSHLEHYEENVQKEQGKSSSELPWATKLKGKNLMAEIQVEQVVAQMRALNLF